MLYSYEITLLILCPLIFLSSFIDSIAGGGGLISLPAYIFAGLPVHMASGTNKFTASFGTATAVGNYFKGGSIDFPAAIPGSIAALIGSLIGTNLALSLSPRTLQICLMVILPLAGIFIFVNKNIEPDSKRAPGIRAKIIIAAFIGLICGCYDGFFGPGTGTFITLALSGLIHLDLLKSAGTARLINFSSGLAAMVTWLINGKILFPVAIPCVICSMAGAFFGSRMALKVGKRLIRIVLIIVVALLFVKILSDLLTL